MDWGGRYAPGLRDTDPKTAQVRLLVHLGKAHPELVEKVSLDACPVCGKEMPGPDSRIRPGMRYMTWARHLGTHLPEAWDQVCELLGISPTLEEVEVTAAVLRGEEPLGETKPPSPPPQDTPSLKEPPPPQDEPPSQEKQPEPSPPPSPTPPPSQGEPPSEEEEEGEEMETREVSETLERRLHTSHGEARKEEAPPPPFPEEEEEEEGEGRPWFKWAALGLGGLAVLGLGLALVKRLLSKGQPGPVPAGSTPAPGEGAAQAAPPPQPTQPALSQAEEKKISKLPPSIQEKIRRGELSLDEVLTW